MPWATPRQYSARPSVAMAGTATDLVAGPEDLARRLAAADQWLR